MKINEQFKLDMLGIMFFDGCPLGTLIYDLL